jgi:protein-disulfide isomerase
LLRNHAALQPEKLKEYATSLQLDRARFDNALATGKFKDKVERDLHDGLDLGVNATPTWFVNGRKVIDLSYASLKAQIEAALKEVSSPAAKLP